MESLSMAIAPTKITPLVKLDARRGMLAFKGRSSPSASLEFYHPIMTKLDGMIDTGLNKITANFAFEYFNTSSSKCLFDVMKRLARFQADGKNVVINWFYEQDDEDMRETGEDYEDILDLQFNYREVESLT
jgi:hypothetical protein